MGEEKIIDEIRSRIPIVRFIGEYVPLKQAGRNFKGLCPFHQEKTPSFMVSDEKQIFHCFGCGLGGDCFTFLMKFNGLSFPEALKELAKRAGVPLPSFKKESNKADLEETRKKNFGLRINEIAKDFFVQNLNDPRKGKQAREYLASRGFKKETLAQHFLGYAPQDWDGLHQELLSKKAPLEMAASLGLIRKSPNKEGYYDFFRDRVMFPIHDLEGRIIGFGGRTLTKEEPKYLNSADSFLYNKSKSAFGLYFGKEAIRKQDEVILVEGYLDCLALRQAGILNVVAPLGTALTPDHLRLLSRYTKNFVVAFDGDPAGRQAACRIIPLFLELHLTPKALDLPKGMDPDSFIQKEGKEAFDKLKAEAKTLFEYFLETVIEEEGKGTQATLNRWEKIRPVLQQVRNPLEAGIYKKKIAEKLGINEEWLGTAGPGTRDQGPETYYKEEERKFPEEERVLIAAMVLKPSTIKTIQEAGEIFTHPTLKLKAKQLFEQYADKKEVTLASCQGSLEEDLAGWIREMALLEEEESVWEKAVQDCLSKIQGRNLDRKIQGLNQEIQTAENKGDEEELSKLLGQKARLLKEKHNLEGRIYE